MRNTICTPFVSLRCGSDGDGDDDGAGVNGDDVGCDGDGDGDTGAGVDGDSVDGDGDDGDCALYGRCDRCDEARGCGCNGCTRRGANGEEADEGADMRGVVGLLESKGTVYLMVVARGRGASG